MTMPLVRTLLLTAGGGDIALSIARFMREDGLAERIVAADARDDHAGYAVHDANHVLPRADDPAYTAALSALIEREQADIAVPLADAELARLLQDGLRQSGLPLVMANDEAIAAGLDKWITYQTLRQHDVPTPETGIIGHTDPDRWPCIVKPRRGQGSKGLALVKQEEWPRIRDERAGDLWQRWLSDDEAEYTCGLFRAPGTPLRTISFRRKLQGGLTGFAETVIDPEIEEVLQRVADAVDLRGSINVQLRKDSGKPYVFEINPRFSSTVGFRHRIGFKDFLWSMEDRLGRPHGSYAAPPEGVRIYRISHEVVRAR